jgi:hypothetical protein
MKNLNLPKINYHLDRKTYLPAIMALLLSVVPWYFSSHFSTAAFSKNISIQILFFLATFMVNFLTLDRLTNKTHLRLMAPLAIIPLLIFIILLLSKQRYISMLGLLTIVPFITTFLPFDQKNGIGLISFALSLGTLNPMAFFYIRNGFAINIILKLGLLLSLTYIVILFSAFVTENRNFRIFTLGLVVVIAIASLILLKSWSALIYPIFALVGWVVAKIKLPRNITVLILITLACVLMLFTISN